MDVKNLTQPIWDRLAAGEHQRLLAFGSSNTERRIVNFHWFDCLELALMQQFGRLHTAINTGIGGDTSEGLLNRFDRDAAFYQPDLVLITIGGNDSNPGNSLNEASYRANLCRLKSRFDQLNTRVIFQTYYACDPEGVSEEHFQAFQRYMQIIREVADETDAGLIDHLARWEPLRLQDKPTYQSLMADAMHVNPLGNRLIGLDLIRALGLAEPAGDDDYWRAAKDLRGRLDQLASKA